MNWHKYYNPASIIGLVSILFNLVLSVAYFVQQDFRRAAYFFFAACITSTVVL
jgi:hypothetical protein